VGNAAADGTLTVGVTEAYRQLVVARAGGACEYCRLLQDATGMTFHIEHVIPRILGGPTILTNLALSCPGCNLAKGQRISAEDSTGIEQPLFNPRGYDPASLGWHLHFTLDRSTGRIIAKTSCGEATIVALRFNDKQRSFARKLQVEAGLIS
jgi:hypothetical protein